MQNYLLTMLLISFFSFTKIQAQKAPNKAEILKALTAANDYFMNERILLRLNL
jgi:hypothetical protein